MSVVFVRFSNIQFELALGYHKNKKAGGVDVLNCGIWFYHIYSNGFNCSKHTVHKQAHCTALTPGPHCLSIMEQTSNEIVLSSKVYKEAFYWLETYMI